LLSWVILLTLSPQPVPSQPQRNMGNIQQQLMARSQSSNVRVNSPYAPNLFPHSRSATWATSSSSSWRARSRATCASTTAATAAAVSAQAARRGARPSQSSAPAPMSACAGSARSCSSAAGGARSECGARAHPKVRLQRRGARVQAVREAARLQRGGRGVSACGVRGEFVVARQGPRGVV